MLICSLWISDAFSNENFEGNGLSRPFVFELDFTTSDHVLVVANQHYADYTLSLLEESDSSLVRQVDISSHRGLDEVMLVSKSDCKQCLVKLSSAEKIDTESKYKITVLPLDGDVGVKVFGYITIAGENSYNSRFAKDGERKFYLRESLKNLKAAIGVPVIREMDQWHDHALLIMIDSYASLEDDDGYHNSIKNLLERTKSTSSKYGAYAYYEYGSSLPNHEKKIHSFNNGLAIAQELGDQSLYAAGINLKAITMIRNGDLSDAITLLEEAKDLHLSEGRIRAALRPLHNLSWANRRLGNIPAALAYATEQKLIAEKYEQDEIVVWALYNLALAYGFIDELAVADNFIQRALEKHGELPKGLLSSADMLEGYLWQERAVRLLEQGALGLAEISAQEMLRTFTILNKEGRAADAKAILGDIAMAQNEFKLAKKYLDESLKFDQENDRPRSHAKRSLRMAGLLMSNAEYVRAEKYQTQAVNRLSETEEVESLSEALLQSVDLLYRLGAVEAALTLTYKVENVVSSHGRPQHKAKLSFLRARTLLDLGDFSSAEVEIVKTKEIIESTLDKSKRRDIRRAYLSLQKSVFELNIELLSAQNSRRPEQETILLAEEFKARTYREQILFGKSSSRLSVEQEELRKKLHQKILNNAMAINFGPSEQKLVIKNSKILGERLERLESSIRVNASDRNSLILIPSLISEVGYSEPNELIAYYFIGDKMSWLWAIVDDQIFKYSLPASGVINPMVSKVLNIYSKPPQERAGVSAWDQQVLLRQLSEILISPLGEILVSKKIEKITVIPDGAIEALPFSALLDLENDPLVLNYAISQAPSLRVKSALEDRDDFTKPGNDFRALVVADPVTLNKDQNSLNRIPFAGYEAGELAKLLPKSATILLRENAIKSMFLAELHNEYDLLHFATHGLVNAYEPNLSGLVFSSIREEDEYLWLIPEITSADLNVGLVVLSACESSTGKEVVGEGLFSLARAFIEGGANQVIGSLWKVDDQVTSKLMTQFYSNLLNDEQTVSQSLRNAKISILKNSNYNWSDPYFWSGFELQGVDRNI